MRIFIAISLIIMGIWSIVGLAYYLYISFGWFSKFFHGVVGFHRPDDRNVWMQGFQKHCRCKVCKRVLVLDEIGEWMVEK